MNIIMKKNSELNNTYHTWVLNFTLYGMACNQGRTCFQRNYTTSNLLPNSLIVNLNFCMSVLNDINVICLINLLINFQNDKQHT